jgi:hypothetical protein
VQLSPEWDNGLKLDLPSPSMIVEPAHEITVPNADLVTSIQDESANDSADGNVEDRTPYAAPLEGQVVAPTMAAYPDDPVTYAIQESRVEEIHPEQAGNALKSHPAANKSKWQTWKEKVQGFIKKIFG